jgi:hypothetical protein
LEHDKISNSVLGSIHYQVHPIYLQETQDKYSPLSVRRPQIAGRMKDVTDRSRFVFIVTGNWNEPKNENSINGHFISCLSNESCYMSHGTEIKIQTLTELQ